MSIQTPQTQLRRAGVWWLVSAVAFLVVLLVLLALPRGGAQWAGVHVLGANPAAASGNNNGCGVGNNGPSGSKDCSITPKAFTMTGTVSSLLAPGAQRTLAVTVKNPNAQDMQVTRVSGVAGTPANPQANPNKPSCSGGWVTIGTYQYVSGTKVVAPANGQVVVNLPIQLTDLSVNQDNCKNKTFPITLSGTGEQVH